MAQSGPPPPCSDPYTPLSAAGQSTRQILSSDKFSSPFSNPNINPFIPRTAIPSAFPLSQSNDPNDPNSASFQPHIFRRSSTNYAQAEALSRAAASGALDDSNERDRCGYGNEGVESLMRGRGEGEEKGVVDGGGLGRKWKKLERNKGVGSMTWKPQVGRRQSWNHEDLKRELQMSIVVEKEEKQVVGSGFSEKGV